MDERDRCEMTERVRLESIRLMDIPFIDYYVKRKDACRILNYVNDRVLIYWVQYVNFLLLFLLLLLCATVRYDQCEH